MMGSVTRGSAPASAASACSNSGSGNLLGQAAHLPQRLAAVEPERAEGVGRGELLQAGALQPAAAPQIAHVGEGMPRLRGRLLMPPRVAERPVTAPVVGAIEDRDRRTGSPVKGRRWSRGRLRSKQMRVEIGGNGVAHRDEALHVVFAQSVDPGTQRPSSACARGAGLYCPHRELRSVLPWRAA